MGISIACPFLIPGYSPVDNFYWKYGGCGSTIICSKDISFIKLSKIPLY
jgi:hypothetical protein